MGGSQRCGSLTLLLMLVSGITFAQSKPASRNLVINGKSAESATAVINNRTYVDLKPSLDLRMGH